MYEGPQSRFLWFPHHFFYMTCCRLYGTISSSPFSAAVLASGHRDRPWVPSFFWHGVDGEELGNGTPTSQGPGWAVSRFQNTTKPQTTWCCCFFLFLTSPVVLLLGCLSLRGTEQIFIHMQINGQHWKYCIEYCQHLLDGLWITSATLSILRLLVWWIELLWLSNYKKHFSKILWQEWDKMAPGVWEKSC